MAKSGCASANSETKEMVNAGLAWGRAINMDDMILHQLLQGSRRPKFVECVAGSVELHVDGEGAMRRAKVPHSNTKERDQLHRSCVSKGIIPSCRLKGVMRQACVGTRGSSPLVGPSPEVAPALLEHAFDGRHIVSIRINIASNKAFAFRSKGMVVKATLNDGACSVDRPLVSMAPSMAIDDIYVQEFASFPSTISKEQSTPKRHGSLECVAQWIQFK